MFTDLITVGNTSDAYRKITLQQPAVQNLPIHASIVETHAMSSPFAKIFNSVLVQRQIQ